MLVSHFEFTTYGYLKIFKTLWLLVMDRLHLPQAVEILRGDSLNVTTKSAMVPGIKTE